MMEKDKKQEEKSEQPDEDEEDDPGESSLPRMLCWVKLSAEKLLNCVISSVSTWIDAFNIDTEKTWALKTIP